MVGAGGHGRVAADCASAQNAWTEIVFLDDRWPSLDCSGKWPVAGHIRSITGFTTCDNELFVAIGHSPTRMALLSQFQQSGYQLATIVHPRAIISSETKIDRGVLIVGGAVINIDAKVSLGCIINTGASVDHDCVLNNGVHICPGAHLGGDVQVGARSWIGIGAAVRQGVRIGRNVTVGAGAVVVSDVPDGETVVGIPAKPLTRC